MLQKFKQPFFYNTNECLWIDENNIIEKWVIVEKFGSVDTDTKMSSVENKMHQINNHNLAQKLKEMEDIHRNKIELEKKNLKKNLILVLRNVY